MDTALGEKKKQDEEQIGKDESIHQYNNMTGKTDTGEQPMTFGERKHCKQNRNAF